MISATLGALVWIFISQHLASMLQNVAQNIAASEFKNLLSTFTLQRKVQNAITRALTQFQNELNDPALLSALQRDQAFDADQDVAKALAQVAVDPQQRDAQTQRLATLMRGHAPGFPDPRYQRAAQLLIAKVLQEIGGIKALQDGLQKLETRSIRERLDRPDYAPDLYKNIFDAARRIESRLNRGYISTGHLLYAIVAQHRSVAAWILLNTFKVSEADILSALTIIQVKHGLPPDTLSDGAQKALKRAPELAQECGALETGTEHVLLALGELALQGQQQGVTIRAIFDRLKIDHQALYGATASVAHAQSAVQSVIMSFCDEDASAAQHGGGEAELPMDPLETLRSFGV